MPLMPVPMDTEERRHGPVTAAETELGVALTAIWMLATGRRLGDVPLAHGLAPEELIEFWADDLE